MLLLLLSFNHEPAVYQSVTQVLQSFPVSYQLSLETSLLCHVVFELFLTGPEPKPEFKGDERTFRLWLDTNQYQQDMAETVHGSEVINPQPLKIFHAFNAQLLLPDDCKIGTVTCS